LLARLSRAHLAGRAGITLPVFSPDAEVVLANGGSGPDFWDAESGRRHSFGEKTFTKSHGLKVNALDFASDGHRIGVGMPGTHEGGRLLVWDLTSEALIGSHEVEEYDVKAVQFSPDGRWLGWLGDGPVGIWDPVGGLFLRMTHTGATSLAFRKSGQKPVQFLTAGGRDLWIWEPSNMELLKELRFDSDRPLLGLSRDGRVIAFTDGQVLDLWDTETGQMTASLRDLKGNIVSFCSEAATGRIVVGTEAGMIYLWDPAASPLPRAQVAAHEGPVEALACGHEGRVVSAGWDSARVWSLEKLAREQTPSQSRSGR
jgi:WD40 repeat protein